MVLHSDWIDVVLGWWGFVETSPRLENSGESMGRDKPIHLQARNGVEAGSLRNVTGPRTLALLLGRLKDRNTLSVNLVVAALEKQRCLCLCNEVDPPCSDSGSADILPSTNPAVTPERIPTAVDARQSEDIALDPRKRLHGPPSRVSRADGGAA